MLKNVKIRQLFPIGKHLPALYWNARPTKKFPTPAIGDRNMIATSNRRFDAVPRLALAAMVMGVFLKTPASAAAKRCDWHGPKSTGETTYKKCVDYVGNFARFPRNSPALAVRLCE